MSFNGMNVEAVRSLAGRLDSEGKELLSVGSQIEKILSELGSNWAGRDFQEFRSWWFDQHKPALNRLVDLVEGLGRSARDNAAAQERVSERSMDLGPVSVVPMSPDITFLGDQPGGAGAPMATAGEVGASSGALSGSNRTWQEVSVAYASDQALGGYSADGDFRYQCTAWANFRWHELGHKGLVSGHGYAMAGNAGGTIDTTPGLGAMVSYGSADGFGHVMIVEEISPDGLSARISEMNVGADPFTGLPQEYRSDRFISKLDDGWYIDGNRLTIANLNLDR
jgi:WXG100 family type VII secretion target